MTKWPKMFDSHLSPLGGKYSKMLPYFLQGCSSNVLSKFRNPDFRPVISALSSQELLSLLYKAYKVPSLKADKKKIRILEVDGIR